MNMYHLLNMGGYGCYVWPAYAITFLVFGINLVLSAREKNQVKKIILAEVNKST